MLATTLSSMEAHGLAVFSKVQCRFIASRTPTTCRERQYILRNVPLFEKSNVLGTLNQ